MTEMKRLRVNLLLLAPQLVLKQKPRNIKRSR
jgi:hypothetical protein